MATVTDIRKKRTYETCPCCGADRVKCLADPPGSWDITHIECAECGMVFWAVNEDDLPSDDEPYP